MGRTVLNTGNDEELTLVFGSQLVSPFLGSQILVKHKIDHFGLPTKIDLEIALDDE